ncbi:MAG: hypothetical protein WC289_00650 [Patescibacteria group bacterium]
MSKFTASFEVLDRRNGEFNPFYGPTPVIASGDAFQGVKCVTISVDDTGHHFHFDDYQVFKTLLDGPTFFPFHARVNVPWDSEDSTMWWQQWKTVVAGIPREKVKPVKILDLRDGQFSSLDLGIWLHGCRIYAIFPLTEDDLFEVAQKVTEAMKNQNVFQIAVQMLLYYASQPEPQKAESLFTSDDANLLAEIQTLFHGHKKFRETIGESRLANFARRVHEAINAGL